MNMDLKLLNEELVRLHNALTIGANQDVPLAEWAMKRITSIHKALLVHNYFYRETPSEANYIANSDTEISTKGFTTYADKNESIIKAKDVIDGTWMDSTELIWHPAIEGTYTYTQALAKAKELGLRLPTKEEFEQAEKEGIRAMFNDFKDLWFWSSSELGTGFAWGFSGYDGFVGSVFRDYVVNSVRCVSRAGR